MKAIPFLLLFLLLTAPLKADIVSFKNGRVEDNVKSRVLSSSVVMTFQNGTMETVPKAQLRSVKIRPVNWPPAELAAKPAEAQQAEEIRVAEASEKGDTWEPRPDDEKIDPWTSAGYGLIPGYSGYFRTGQDWKGYSFATLEALLVLNALDFSTASKDYELDRLAPIALIFGQPFQTTEAETLRITALSYNVYLAKQTYSLKGGITGRTFFQVQNDPAAQKNTLRSARNQTYGALAFVLLLDGALSYLAADEWNQGVWTGPPGEQPVGAMDRGIRSLIFPGWGQMYAGQDSKGLAYMITGGALLLYAIASEQQLITAQRDYEAASDTASKFNTLDATGTVVNQNTLLGLKAALVYPARLEVEKRTSQRRQAVTIAASFWAFNVLDAIFLSGPSRNISIAPYVSPEEISYNGTTGNRYGLAVQWRF
ncbi:MAG: hypothetical protein KDK25_08105 [Leptospiraceae bacterium]|nr:hypothetical protein [Leptospiraceae bacterium]